MRAYFFSVIFCAFSLFLSIETQSQIAPDTLRIFQYNLLNYGVSTSQCNSSNNGVINKDALLREILAFTNPDVMAFNEIGANSFYLDNLQSQVMNDDTLQKSYDGAEYSNNGFSNLINGFFFNTEKLTLYSQSKIDKDLNGSNLVRVIDHYQLYYNDSLLSDTTDTTFVNFFVAHLKAGSSSSDATARAKATAALMDYLDNHSNLSNAFFLGDFNMKNSSEAGFQNLVNNNNEAIEFQDPINMLGNWNNSSAFASVHTQSTRVSSNTSGGCFSGGGMDDRFDMILCWNEVLTDSNDVTYISGSYKALGQDGMRLNETITFPTNNSIPSTISQALYDMSDHLPVMMDVTVERIQPPAIPNVISEREKAELKYNSLMESELDVRWLNPGSSSAEISIFSLTGRMIGTWDMTDEGGNLVFNKDVSGLSSGIYFFQIRSAQTTEVKKLIKP